MLIGKSRRGDTIVEVVLAFGVFTLVAVGTNALMNRGVSLAEQSLEITLVRAQIDAQAELLRYARSVNSDAWSDITDHAKTAVGGAAIDEANIPDLSTLTDCPSSAPQYSFMLNVTDDVLVFHRLDTAPTSAFYTPASVHSQFSASTDSPDTPAFSGIWVVPIRSVAVVAAATVAYDMHIGTCWNVPGADRPFTLSTIVRLYDTP